MNEQKTSTPTDFRAWAPDFDKWPEQWMYADRDLDYGRRLLPYFAEFLQALYAQGLSKKTFGQYRDSLSLLGSSIIRNVGLFEEYADDPLEKLIDSVAGNGMVPEHDDQMSATELGEFARLCRRIEKYLKKNPPTTRRTTPQDPS